MIDYEEVLNTALYHTKVLLGLPLKTLKLIYSFFFAYLTILEHLNNFKDWGMNYMVIDRSIMVMMAIVLAMLLVVMNDK